LASTDGLNGLGESIHERTRGRFYRKSVLN
jgi:hypothetical protein